MSPVETIVTDATAIKTPPLVGQAAFPQGMAGGTSPIETSRILGPFSAEIYVHLWLKLSSNWRGPPDSIQQIIQLERLNDAGVPGALVAFGKLGAIQLQWHNFTPGDLFVQLPNLDVMAAELVRGQWHELELSLVMNTGASQDGAIHVWVDGIKTHQNTAVRFVSAGAHHFAKIVWNPIWGSSGTLDRDQEMFFDHLYVSGKLVQPSSLFDAALQKLDLEKLAFLDAVLVTSGGQAPAAPSQLEVT